MAMFEIHAVDEQIKALPTVSTASGSVATFDTDMTENLIEVKCQIVAKQEGLGTPSPDNVRPIQTYDSLTLYHNDINMWDEEWELGIINSTTGENEPSTTAYRSKNYIPVKPNMQIYIVKPLVNLGLRFYDINKNFISSLVVYVNYNITIPADCYYVRFHNTSASTYANDISFNYPSTDTQYHAFNGAYIPFGQTVAKGTLNVTTGKLEITHGVYVITGNETFTTTGAGQKAIVNPSLNTLNAKKFDNSENANVVCEFAESKPYATINVSGTTTGIGIGIYYIIIGSEQYNAWNDCVGKKLVYELATPIEIQLDSTQITALLNENNIWCDTGDTEVKYLLTVGKKIA